MYEILIFECQFDSDYITEDWQCECGDWMPLFTCEDDADLQETLEWVIDMYGSKNVKYNKI